MVAQDISRYGDLSNVDLTKLAGTPFERHVVGQQANRRIWQALLAALATGGIGRSLLGASRMATNPGSGFAASPSYQEVGMSRPQEEEENGELKIGSEKAAAPKLPPTGLPTDDFTSQFSRFTEPAVNIPLARREGSIPQSGMDFMRGATADKMSSIPMFLPLLLAATGGGLYGGYKLVDKFLDARREGETEGQLSKAKGRYNELLKQSTDDAEIHDELDELADVCLQSQEKTALLNPANMAKEWGGLGTGGMMSYALLSALMSGKLSYDYFRKRNQEEISRIAVERRAKERRGGMAPLQFKLEDEQYA